MRHQASAKQFFTQCILEHMPPPIIELRLNISTQIAGHNLHNKTHAKKKRKENINIERKEKNRIAADVDS